eukprot:scaffold37634_cov19-Tisochrysis_lutea.AAC.3
MWWPKKVSSLKSIHKRNLWMCACSPPAGALLPVLSTLFKVHETSRYGRGKDGAKLPPRALRCTVILPQKVRRGCGAFLALDFILTDAVFYPAAGGEQSLMLCCSLQAFLTARATPCCPLFPSLAAPARCTCSTRTHTHIHTQGRQQQQQLLLQQGPVDLTAEDGSEEQEEGGSAAATPSRRGALVASSSHSPGSARKAGQPQTRLMVRV